MGGLCVFVTCPFLQRELDVFLLCEEAMLPACYQGFADVCIVCSPSGGSAAQPLASGSDYKGSQNHSCKGSYKDSFKVPVRIRDLRHHTSAVSR